MPQMAPLMWTTLFSTFIVILFLVSTKIAYLKLNFNGSTSHSMAIAELKPHLWKW